jgi:anaerobic magnesium-protoporphyrin IX monomethyl ester cyclase
MKILFTYLYGKIPHFPIGMGFLSSNLKMHGHETRLFGLKSEQLSEDLLGSIRTWKPDVIGFSSGSSIFERIKEFSRLIKQQFKDVLQICGGIHPTLVPGCIEEAPLDAVCRGEGEHAFVELVERLSKGLHYTDVKGFWFKANGNIIRNSMTPLIQNLNTLPMPDHDFYYSQDLPGKVKGIAEFMFSRGCPFHCSYCSNHALKRLYRGQRYVRYPSVEKAILELITVSRKYKVNYLIIHDDTLSLNKKWFYDFCEEYKDKIKIPFLCFVRPGTCTKDMFKLLKEAHCDAVGIGLESGNLFIREKVLNREIKNEAILGTFRLAHEMDIKTLSFSMIGLPHETPEAIVDTIKFTAQLGDKNIPWNFIFHPYPNTKLYEHCKEKGWIEKKSLGFEERSRSALRLPTLSRKDIHTYFDNFRILIEVEKRALTKDSYSIAKLLTKLFPFPKLLFAVKTYYYIYRMASHLCSRKGHRSQWPQTQAQDETG